jgi:flagellar assembly protein FliH
MVLALEVFETDPKADCEPIILDQIAFAREQSLSYDIGYRAGWEQASVTAAALDARAKTDLAQHLQQLSFTYHEAQAHVLAALNPLFVHLVGQIMPQIARASLAPIVVETLMPLADRLGHAAVTVRVNPASAQAVQTLIDASTSLPLTIQQDAALGEGQAHLHLGAVEAEVDLDQACADIAAALHGFLDLFGKDHLHG